MSKATHFLIAGFICGSFLLAVSTSVSRPNKTIAPQGIPATPPSVDFVDIAARAGLTAKTEDGGEKTKKYIIETTGSGAAFFDYDNDGWPDIFLVNGTTLEGFPQDKQPTSPHYS
jgi:enediyne biosynthesis protein E4